MIRGSQGNAVPNNNDGSNHSRSDSGSYTYSTSEEGEHNPPAAAAQQTPQQPSRPAQQQQPQFSPVSVQDTKQQDKKQSKKEDKKRSKHQSAATQQMDRERDGDGEEGGQRGNKKKHGIANLPGAGKVHAVAMMAATPASADTQRVTIYLYFLFACVHTLFVILSCVLSQLDISGKGCYTYWGFKADCDATSYTIRASLLQNTRLQQNLQAGAAMSIFAVITAVASLCAAWLLVIRARLSLRLKKKQRRDDAARREVDDEEASHDPDQDASQAKKTTSYINVGTLKWVAVGAMGLNLVFALIAWAIIAGLYSARPGEDPSAPRGMTYGVGFGLGITAWICELIMLAVFVFAV